MKTASEKRPTGGATVGGPLYLDASAWAKLYLPEPESAVLETMLLGRRDLCVSDLGETEIVSALARRRREGAIADADLARLRAQLAADRGSGAFRRIDLTPDVHREAERILLLTDDIPLRAADALHLALASAAGAAAIATYDARLAAAARKVGVVVVPA